MGSTITLLDGESSGTGPEEQVRFSNERGELQVWGAFSGANVTFEFSPDDGSTWVPLFLGDVPLVVTEPKAVGVSVVYGQPLRATINDPGETSIDCKLYETRF